MGADIPGRVRVPPESKVSSLYGNPAQSLTWDPEFQRALSGIPHFYPMIREPVSRETPGSSSFLGETGPGSRGAWYGEEAFIIHKVPR